LIENFYLKKNIGEYLSYETSQKKVSGVPPPADRRLKNGRFDRIKKLWAELNNFSATQGLLGGDKPRSLHTGLIPLRRGGVYPRPH